MTITITPAQAAQTAEYTQAEKHIRQLLTNGLNLQIKAVEARVQLEARLAPGGDLEEMAEYYATQYARLGADAQTAFEAIEARVLANQSLMCEMHTDLQAAEPGTDLFPGIICPASPEPELP